MLTTEYSSVMCHKETSFSISPKQPNQLNNIQSDQQRTLRTTSFTATNVQPAFKRPETSSATNTTGQ